MTYPTKVNMDYAASTLSRIQGSGTARSDGAFGKAIDEFLAELKEKHKEDAKNLFLQALIGHGETKRAEDGVSQSEVSARELQNSILQLDAQKRAGKGYRLLHRLNPFLDVLKTVLKKSEAFAQVAPFGVAIAFIGARVVLEMALAVEEYLEVVVTAMERIAGILEIIRDFHRPLTLVRDSFMLIKRSLRSVLSSSKIKGILPRTLLTSLQKETEDALKSLQEDMQVNLGISQAAGLLMADIDRQARVDADRRALKNDIRRWIMGQNHVDFKGDYETQLDMRYEDTCAWILQDQRFLDWQDSRDNALLWYNAQPGSGKSVLAATVIDHLAKDNKKVAYFFYSFSKNSSRHVADGLRILALQLLAFVGTPSDKLVDLYETETQFALYLNNLRTTVSVVHELITRNDDLYIVLDGIDECGDEKEMLPLLEKLIEQPTLGTVRWLFTSRVSEVEKAMQRLRAVEMHPSPDNIREDIKNYLAPKISCDDCLRDWVDECDNNFLIARFVSETLGKLTSEEDIKAELKIFPKKLNGYYMRTLAKIDARGEMEQLVARRIFLILGSAQQTISVDELVDALGIRRESQDYSTLRLPKEELIHDLCGSLIVIEQCTAGTRGHSSLVRFCHKSVKDFFQQDPKTCDFGVNESLHKYFVAPSNAHEEIGLDCLTYLMYSRYAKHIDLGFLDSTIPKEHAFLRYAATFWFQHLGDESIEKPSSAAVQTARDFISSKNFWNCLRVQSHIAPYLFGRYRGYRPGGFKMAIRGKEWKGNDGFAIPLPSWLSDYSSDDLMRDQSFCHFAEEWREVIITQPQGLDQCVSMKAFPNSCWLKSLCKTSTVKGVNLAESFGSDIISTSRLLGVGFSGKKLCVDVAYQTKDGPKDVLYRLKQQLFKSNSRPQRSQQKILLDSDISKWAISSVDEEGVSTQFTAWSVDPWTLNIRMMRDGHNEPFNAPSLPIKGRRTSPKISWEMLGYYKHDYHETGVDVDKSIYVIHMSQQGFRANPIDDDDDDDDDGDSNGSDNDSESTSGKEGSDDEEEFSDDDDSSSEGSSDESAAEETSTDESDIESECCNHEDTDCLIIISPGHTPYWTKPWTHPALLWSRNVCAMHPTEPLVAFMITPTQLDVLQRETQRSIEISGLEDEPDDVMASTRELRFSRCGKYLHCLSIVFAEKGHHTECIVTASTLEFPLDREDDAAKTIIASQIARVAYNFAEPLQAIEPPFSLTSWSDDYMTIALPHLTCNPKILKIALSSDILHPVSTLRNPIYFPSSTPRRDARLVHRPSSKDSEGYIFLVLNAVPAVAAAKEDAVFDTSSPVTALRWSVSDDEGWRPWSEDEDGTLSDLTRDYSPLWNFMRGSFVESGKPFSVTVRSGLNWTRKAYLSCV
ncbi:hypothetical protein RRF57_011501 [Xylaria bambusicola]|uniref:NACHT domain-containing protein n=1 Tax=Xylaria bambusicola TaxID=326684 RepID=A0AAN7V2U4_9PEZI